MSRAQGDRGKCRAAIELGYASGRAVSGARSSTAPHSTKVCYSAMIEQSIKALGIRFQARIQLDLFEELFRRRLHDERIKIPKALEQNFLEPATEIEDRIRRAILDYREYQSRKWESELARQRERLAIAERGLARRSTKKALADQRIATKKIAWCESQIADLSRSRLEPQDQRVFPDWYAPVVCNLGSEHVIVPMRYHLRPNDKPSSFDQRFIGLYNARRDNLTGFWRSQFGVQHGVIVVSAFFENVALNKYEHRALAPNETEKNVVVEFRPRLVERGEPTDIVVPCLWDHWVRPSEPELWSFAAITDEPPEDVSSSGHDRCVVALRSQLAELWLAPQRSRDEELFRILSEREALSFKHRLAG